MYRKTILRSRYQTLISSASRNTSAFFPRRRWSAISNSFCRPTFACSVEHLVLSDQSCYSKNLRCHSANYQPSWWFRNEEETNYENYAWNKSCIHVQGVNRQYIFLIKEKSSDCKMRSFMCMYQLWPACARTPSCRRYKSRIIQCIPGAAVQAVLSDLLLKVLQGFSYFV
jgi:hypothetical protein